MPHIMHPYIGQIVSCKKFLILMRNIIRENRRAVRQLTDLIALAAAGNLLL